MSDPTESQPDPWSLALAEYRAGNTDAVVAALQHLIRAEPGSALHHFHLGNLYWEGERFADADACFRKAYELDPAIANLPLQSGLEAARSGLLEEAHGLLQLARAFRPEHPSTLASLGDVQRRLGRLSEAIELLARAARLEPANPEILLDLGIALYQAGRLEEARKALDTSCRLAPSDARAWNNLATVLKQQGRLDDALRYFDQAVRLAPDFAEAHFNRATALLQSGDFLRGWSEYEWRPQSAPVRPLADFLRAGGALEGKTVLLRAEQGIGDLIQFVRYAAWLAQRGARVLVECPESAVELIGTARGVAGAVPFGHLPEFNFDANLLSLPGIIHPAEGPPPCEIPYLFPNRRSIETWVARITRSRLRVGVAWAGNPAHPNDRLRSMPPLEFLPILRHPAVAAYSLQFNPRSGDLSLLPNIEVLPLPANLVDSAAVMMSLDLVITVDTMLAHLAGALGKPVWVLLAYMPDWRWMLGRNDTPWYPTMRLCRQTRPGDWSGVIQRVVAALEEFSSIGSRS